MSKAFTKEDVDLPERSGRRRLTGGLPPGATNYITARGARRLRAELDQLTDRQANADRIAELKDILASIEVVDPPADDSSSVAFGATVTVEDASGKTETYTILGVNELDFEPEGVSWISATGKALLATDLGGRVTLEDGRTVKIVRIQYRS